MEIGVVLRAAVVDLNSLDATMAVVGAAGFGVTASVAWALLVPRLSRRAMTAATRTFAILFVAQAALYALHEWAESRLLPWSDMLHAATEPYGPDSEFGLRVTWALVVLPTAAVVAAFLVQRLARWSANVAVAGSVAATFVLMIGPGIPGRAAADAMPAAAAPTISHDPEPYRQTSHVLFTHMRNDADRGDLAIAAADAPDASRATLAMPCTRVSFGGSRGICLTTRQGLPTRHEAVIFDAGFVPVRTLPLDGAPSRTRVSTDGRYGSITVFVVGEAHGYGGLFSTKTTIVDMRSGDVIGDLEQFTTYRDGARIRAADFNFWGVTFARDSNTFYATLRTGTRNYLVRGDISRRKTTVIHEDVECPSLSPDDRLIAFKRVDGPTSRSWKLHVLDLSTMTDRPIAAAVQYVDDQAEWLDDSHVLYAIPRWGSADVWVAPVDGNGSAHVLIHDAASPIVVRTAAQESAIQN
jgi:hypothetical protein